MLVPTATVGLFGVTWPQNALPADVGNRKRRSIALRRVGDFHVSLCQEEARVFLGRSRERPKQCLQDS